MSTMSLPLLSDSGKQALDQLLYHTVQEKKVPATFFAATNARQTIYENQAGLKDFGDDESEHINRDTTLQLYSMTKFVTCIAALILVGIGALDLDNPQIIEEYLPELGKLEVLTGFDEQDEPILHKPKTKITLRMLMTHTAGLGFFPEDLLTRWQAKYPKPSLLSAEATPEACISPLLYEPGTSWKYSTSIDWVGYLIARVSGLTLDSFFKKHIFSKVDGGMPDTTFYPRADIKERLMKPCVRDPEGRVQPSKEFSPFGPREIDPDKVGKWHAGGLGLFGTTQDYLALCRAVLASDPRYSHSHNNPNPLLKPDMYKELFTGCLGDGPKETFGAFVSEFATKRETFLTTTTVDHSVGGFINLVDSQLGRKKGSVAWSGSGNTFFWIDPETGIAAVCNTQLFSMPPDPWVDFFNDFEFTLYKGLI